jgi:hypothetical protein
VLIIMTMKMTCCLRKFRRVGNNVESQQVDMILLKCSNSMHKNSFVVLQEMENGDVLKGQVVISENPEKGGED